MGWMSCRTLKEDILQCSKEQSHTALCWLVSNFSNKVPQYTAGGHSTTVCGGLKFHFMSLCFNRSARLMVKQNLKPLSAAITSELGSCQE